MPTQPATTLAAPVRLAVVARGIGLLMLGLAALSLAPVVVAVIAGEWGLAWRYAIVALAVAATGAMLARRPAATDVQTNETIVTAAAIFIITPLAMAWPLAASGLGWLDALFEAISGVTTTGLTTIATVEDKPASFLFTRAWMQWYGGLGIAVLAVALLARPGIAARLLASGESENGELVGGARSHARRILVVYVILTIGAILLLWAISGSFAEGALNALAAISTGGFSPHDASLAASNSLAFQVATLLVCLLGAFPLVIYYRMVTKGWRTPIADVQARALPLFALVSMLLATVLLSIAGGALSGQAIRQGALMGLFAQTTSGFSTIDPQTLDPATKLALILAMFIGGGLGSTAGGIKIVRLLILGQLLGMALLRTCTPKHAVVEPSLGRHKLEDLDIQGAILVVGLFMTVIIISWALFLVSGYDPIDALFDVVSATGTVGLSAGVARPELEPWLKVVLGLDMLMGRLEVFAFVVMLYPRTWLGPRRTPA